jgi:hypothetical protein
MDDDQDDIRALIRRSHLGTQTEAARIEQQMARERLRTRTLKAMRLARSNVWRRFLRQRLPSDA